MFSFFLPILLIPIYSIVINASYVCTTLLIKTEVTPFMGTISLSYLINNLYQGVFQLKLFLLASYLKETTDIVVHVILLWFSSLTSTHILLPLSPIPYKFTWALCDSGQRNKYPYVS